MIGVADPGHDESPSRCTNSVYINCPLDASYRASFDAILFATVCCGFEPRSAPEAGTVPEPRIHRVYRTLFDCRYSIHDLSRCTGEGDENLARFNMPLELGMAMARHFQAPNEHQWFALVPRGKSYLRFVSDLAAYDLGEYEPDSLHELLAQVVAWLTSPTRSAGSAVTPDRVLSYLPRFQEERAQLDKKWLNFAPWAAVVEQAIKVTKLLG